MAKKKHGPKEPKEKIIFPDADENFINQKLLVLHSTTFDNQSCSQEGMLENLGALWSLSRIDFGKPSDEFFLQKVMHYCCAYKYFARLLQKKFKSRIAHRFLNMIENICGYSCAIIVEHLGQSIKEVSLSTNYLDRFVEWNFGT